MESRTITPSDLLPLEEYARRRERVRDEMIAHKRLRRVEVGPWVSLVFEDRRTVLYQIQEMLRIEHIVKPEAVLHEIETYEELLPLPGELSATFFIEIPDPAQREQALSSFGGIEKAVSLRLGGLRAPAYDKRPIDPRFERPGRASAVYYLGFTFTPEAKNAFVSGEPEVWVDIAHPLYKHSAAMPEATRRALARDLA